MGRLAPSDARVRAREGVDGAAREALRSEARRLTEWLGGQRVFTVYPSQAMQPDATGFIPLAPSPG